jgi:flagellar protein FlbD
MIYVTRLNHTSVVLNSDLIEHIEATPDTVITLTTGQRITVLETASEVVAAVRDWRRSLLVPEGLTAPGPAESYPEIVALQAPGLTIATHRFEGHRNG